MESHITLVKNTDKRMEKRILPRFPFSFFIFKSAGKSPEMFEIKDISRDGMRLCLKSGEHSYKKGDQIKGTLKLKERAVRATGTVRWANEESLGVEFTDSFPTKHIPVLLNRDYVLDRLESVHEEDYSIDLPPNLRYWLRCDGVFEFFIWACDNGGITRFQMVFTGFFLEWQEEEKLKTGTVHYVKTCSLPSSEEEFSFHFESKVNPKTVEFAFDIVKNMTEEHLPDKVLTFIRSKIAS